jgi:MFS family permease
LKLETPLGRQFMIAIAFMALMTLPLNLAGNVPMLALGLFVGGASISPTFITAFGLIERLVPAAKLTEGITWAMTGIGIGMAAGSFASGWVIDLYGAGAGFWVSVAAGGVAVIATFAGYCVLTARPAALRPAMA